MTNEIRRTRAHYVLHKYQGISEHAIPSRAAITDLIADLLHYAHAKGFNTTRALELAQIHFNAEINADDND